MALVAADQQTCDGCKEQFKATETVSCDVCKDHMNVVTAVCQTCVESGHGEKGVQEGQEWETEWFCPSCLSHRRDACRQKKKYWESDDYREAKRARLQEDDNHMVLEATMSDVRSKLLTNGKKNEHFKRLIVDVFATSPAVKVFMEEEFPQYSDQEEVFTEAMRHIFAENHFKFDNLYPDPNL